MMEDFIIDSLKDNGILGALVMALGWFFKKQIGSLLQSNEKKYDLILGLFEEFKEQNNALEIDYRDFLKEALENKNTGQERLEGIIKENSKLLKQNMDLIAKTIRT